MNEYTVSGSLATSKSIYLPKPWFRAVNGIGSGVDGVLTGKRHMVDL